MDKDTKSQLLAQLQAAAKGHLDERNVERDKAVEKMQALGRREDVEARQILLGYLSQEENELLAPLAASRLSEIGGKDVMIALMNLLETVSDSVRILIIQILAEIGDSEASPALIEILQSEKNDDVRQRAASALGKTGGTTVYEALMTALDSENNLRTRQQIIGALGWLGDEACIPELVQIMETDPEKETRTFATEALGRIGSEKCYDPLLDTLQNHDAMPIVRYYAAHALGLLGDSRAIEPLEAIVNDESEHSWVAQMASESLEKLSE